MFRLDRSRGAGPHLVWKVRLFSAGAVLALAGIFLDDRRITGAAIVVLAAGMALRFLPADKGEDPDDGSGDDRGA
jgi:hypothetical protein